MHSKIVLAFLLLGLTFQCHATGPLRSAAQLLELQIHDEGDLGISNFEIDNEKLICDPDSETEEPFFPTQLTARVYNAGLLNLRVVGARLRAVSQDGETIWRSRRLPVSYTSIPPQDSGQVLTVLTRVEGSSKSFIVGSVPLASAPEAFNLKVRLLLRDSQGRRSRVRGAFLVLRSNVNRCA